MSSIALKIDDFSTDGMMTPKSVSMVFGLLSYQYLKQARRPEGPPGPPWYEKNGRIFYERTEVIEFIQSLRKTR